MVKCADCGFLAVRNADRRELVEMEGEYRTTGESPKRKDVSPHYDWYESPLCFKQANDIRAEIENVQGKNDSERICLVLQKGRECKSFTEWYQGFTPKEIKK